MPVALEEYGIFFYPVFYTCCNWCRVSDYAAIGWILFICRFVLHILLGMINQDENPVVLWHMAVYRAGAGSG